MNILATLRESEIYTDREITPKNKYGVPRKAVRIVLFDEQGNVALGHYAPKENRPSDEYNIPGGGIEDGESVHDALVREAKEEIGCEIKNIQEMGMVMEYGVGKKIKHFQENHCFVADVDGEKGEPKFSEEEIEDGLGIIWMPLDKAIKKLKLQRDHFGTRKTLILLERAMEVTSNL